LLESESGRYDGYWGRRCAMTIEIRELEVEETITLSQDGA